MNSRPPEYTYDIIDAERASQLLRALPTRQDGDYIEDLPEGTPLPKGHHLVFFRPRVMLRDLGPDGSATEHNAPPPYTRRMWAGGSIAWRGEALKVGAAATQVITIPKVEAKKGMVFVHQQRIVYPSKIAKGEAGEGWAVKEIRTHVFRPPAEAQSKLEVTSQPARGTSRNSTSASTSSVSLPDEQPSFEFTYTPTSPLLFLFSALTHNPHKVHYDQQWSIDKEGQPGPLVHGPLTALLLMELAARAEHERRGKSLEAFDYRATSPVHLDKEVKLGAWWNDKQGERLRLGATQGGSVGMTATARYGHA